MSLLAYIIYIVFSHCSSSVGSFTCYLFRERNAGAWHLFYGTFPGQTHAYQDTWFYWDENTQEWKPTHGVKATMPMYNADMEIIKNVVKFAKEVFG